jgi:hypothetical protein
LAGRLNPQAGYHTHFDYVNNFRKLNLTKLSDSTYQECIKIVLTSMAGPDHVTFLPSDFPEAGKDRGEK